MTDFIFHLLDWLLMAVVVLTASSALWIMVVAWFGDDLEF